MRFKVPDSLKYFCQSEAVAYYLQKYVVYRKRKIYVGKRTFAEMAPILKKYKNEKFLLPSSDVLKPEIPNTLDELKINYRQSTFYRTVVSDLSHLKDVTYDILVFLVLVESNPYLKTSLILNKMTPASQFLVILPLTPQMKPDSK